MSATLSTPSKNCTASRSQSQNMQNLVEELKDDLVVDVHKSQGCDLDKLLKVFLYYILKDDSKEKKDLDKLQKLIEELERKIDTGVRAKAAEKKAQMAKRGDPTLGEDPNPEITQWQHELVKHTMERQKTLDRLLNECLDKVLPICQVSVLRSHLNEYSRANKEFDLYGPFVDLSNHALDLLKILSTDKDPFKATSSLECRFHVSDPKIIKTDYGDSTVQTNPDVVLTSTLAAKDVNYQLNNKEPNPIYNTAPKTSFKMQQILTSIEFKKSDNLLTNPLASYNTIRQSNYETGDKELSVQYPLDESSPTVVTFNTAIGQPAAKRAKLDPSEPTGISSATESGSSNTGHRSGSRKERRKEGSQQGTKSNNETTCYPPNNSQRTIDARTQCAVYGMEMLSYAIGIHRCKLWVWYYDRQSVIQSNGIDFVKDLPRFLVLLFAFQRFELVDWSIITKLNPDAILAHNSNPTLNDTRKLRSTRSWDTALRERGKGVPTCILEKEHLDYDSIGGQAHKDVNKIKIDLNDWLSHKPHCLGGRATAVNGSSNPDNGAGSQLACKISFPEVARENEGKIIQDIRQEIEEDDETKHLSKHLPDVLMFGDMSRYGTQRIRSLLKLSIEGYRTLRFLISKKMAPLTSLLGADFVKAWLEVVKFHAFLWGRNIEHGDPSLWNVMYNNGLNCGVLGDYDLSISRRRPRVPGVDRTGTIPFMAIDLLSHEYWNGEIERVYRHEFEAFIWILPFVFLRYQNGKSQRGTPVDGWMTSNYITCSEKKFFFCRLRSLIENRARCQSDFQDHWILAEHLLDWWNGWLASIKRAAYYKSRRGGLSTEDGKSVASVWPLFVEQLRLIATEYPLPLGYIDTLIDDLELEKPFWVRHDVPKA